MSKPTILELRRKLNNDPTCPELTEEDWFDATDYRNRMDTWLSPFGWTYKEFSDALLVSLREDGWYNSELDTFTVLTED